MEDAKKVLGAVTITPEIIADINAHVNHVADFKKKVQDSIAGNTTNLTDVILFGAIHIGASDIHIEPEENSIRLRLRVDGVLQDIAFFEQPIYHNLLSRLKLLSKIKLNITDKPQDGRFTIVIDNLSIEIRTSTLPAEYGEAVVMRILNPKNLLGLETLGLRKDLYQIFEEEIKKPNGMIVVTGPTGAGKTTTLYAFLMKVKNPEIKIITIEDPIEYHIEGVSQTQVSAEKGYTFSEGLKSIVRQDPDVILVGEIRDLETAKIALQASLTGHLVLSTLHTNDAAGTIPRLVDLGTEPASIASALKMVIAQRLVRKVCPTCSTQSKPSAEVLAELKKGLKNVDLKFHGIDLADIKIASVKKEGCETCNFTGYKGRKGLYEVFLVDGEIERFILTNPPVSAIKAMAIKKGMITMYQSGLLEVALGQTTLEEVKKVAEEDTDF